jgi:hypothetical protein
MAKARPLGVGGIHRGGFMRGFGGGRWRVLIFIASLLAACGGGYTASPRPSLQAPCGPPPPSAAPFLALEYPEPNATNVPASIGMLLFAGSSGGVTIAMRSSSGSTVPIGTPTAAPSPIPTPYATPSNFGGNVPYFAAPIPALSPATTYSLSYTYSDFNGIPPSCYGPATQQLGSFSTGI